MIPCDRAAHRSPKCIGSSQVVFLMFTESWTCIFLSFPMMATHGHLLFVPDCLSIGLALYFLSFWSNICHICLCALSTSTNPKLLSFKISPWMKICLNHYLTWNMLTEHSLYTKHSSLSNFLISCLYISLDSGNFHFNGLCLEQKSERVQSTVC